MGFAVAPAAVRRYTEGIAVVVVPVVAADIVAVLVVVLVRNAAELAGVTLLGLTELIHH